MLCYASTVPLAMALCLSVKEFFAPTKIRILPLAVWNFVLQLCTVKNSATIHPSSEGFVNFAPIKGMQCDKLDHCRSLTIVSG